MVLMLNANIDDCFTHYPLIFLNLILIFFAIYVFKVLKIKNLFDNGKLNLIPFIGLISYLVLFIFTTLFSKCNLCFLFVMINIISLFVVLVLFLKNKEIKENKPTRNKLVIKDDELKDGIGKAIALKEAFNRAAKIKNENLKINKHQFSSWVIECFSDKIVTTQNDKNTSDSFYLKTSSGTNIMALLYEVKDNQIFLLARMSKDLANVISNYHTISKSLYPKAINSDWYVLLIDETYHNIQEVYDVFSMIYLEFLKN